MPSREETVTVERRCHLQGQLLPGPALTERGQRQADALAERLKLEHFDCMYSSDLLRALQTAEAVAAVRRSRGDCGSSTAGGSVGSAVRVDERLRERHLGVLQGLTHAEAAEQEPQAYAALHAEVSGGEQVSCVATHDLLFVTSAQASEELQGAAQGAPEPLSQLQQRAAAVLEDLAARHPGQRLLVVTHGGFLHAVQRWAAALSFAPQYRGARSVVAPRCATAAHAPPRPCAGVLPTAA